jgi:hypothetical protein
VDPVRRPAYMKTRRTLLATFAAATVAMLVLAGAALAAVFSNSSPISIPGSGQATPYPATTEVSGLSGTVTDVNVTLHGMRHTAPDDVEALLVGPGGQKVLLMTDVGGGGDLNGIELTLDDEAAGTLPDSAQISAGSYKPTRGTGGLGLSSPAPAGPYSTSLSAFDGAEPNGTYSLYVFDDAARDAGQVAGGFSLDVQTGTAGPRELLPDLGMAPIANIQVQPGGQVASEPTDAQDRLLRFSTTIVNVGAGDFEVSGERPDTGTTDMVTTQRIYDSAGGFSDRPTNATFFYSGDGHNHWHVRDLEDYTLLRLSDLSLAVGQGEKMGFCFYDNVEYGAEPGTEKYGPGCSNGQPNLLEVTMGLQRGWGDRYAATTHGQFIDITGVPDGEYRLRVEADGSDRFLEEIENNNSTWVDLRITGETAEDTVVEVLAYGPSSPPTG